TSWSYALSRMRIFCPAIVASVSFALVSRCAVLCFARGLRPQGDPPICRARRVRPSAGPAVARRLLDDLRDPAGADGAAALADREPEVLLHGDWLDQVDVFVGTVARRDHFGSLGEVHN